MKGKITPRLVLAFDKFRGTASRAELCSASQAIASRSGWQTTVLALTDGGEGSLEVLGGPNRFSSVQGPLGELVEAGWRMDGDNAYIESATAAGLLMAGGSDGNDPLAARTTGVGQLITAAIEQGAKSILVFLGGSASTDGGQGAIEAIPLARLAGIELLIACDVRTRFVDAAAVFGPQKGATPAQVKLLTRRLECLVDTYWQRFGVDVSTVDGAGAAGGLAGALLAVGGQIVSGFEILAERAELDLHLATADLVITGEGKLDASSFNGKLVGGVLEWARQANTPAAVIVGAVQDLEQPQELNLRCLSYIYGSEKAMQQTVSLVAEQVGSLLIAHGG